MKKLFAISVVVLLASLPGSTFAKDITVTVKGMICGFCAQGITKKMKALPSVKSVNVSLAEKTVKVELNDGKELDDATIESILKDSGYNTEKITRGK